MSRFMAFAFVFTFAVVPLGIEALFRNGHPLATILAVVIIGAYVMPYLAVSGAVWEASNHEH